MTQKNEHIRYSLNGIDGTISSLADFEHVKLQLLSIDSVEFWIYSNSDAMMCMLKNGIKSWLLFLRESGDHGFHSFNIGENDGTTEFTLSNGQIDEFQNSWCIPIELCLNAILQFVEGCDEAPQNITWMESN
jgi:hypothetical protein